MPNSRPESDEHLGTHPTPDPIPPQTHPADPRLSTPRIAVYATRILGTYQGRTAPWRQQRGGVHTVVWPASVCGGETGWGPILDVPVAQRHDAAERCFKCPKERRHGDPGWYVVDLDGSQRFMGPSRLYVCPEHYLDFAVSERGRWTPLLLSGNGNNGDHAQNGSSPLLQEAPACNADEVISLLAQRGLAGWAFLVRDVAAGRVRRVHLRQLPADPEVRRALVAYLHSAGAAVTLSRTFLTQQRRFDRA